MGKKEKTRFLIVWLVITLVFLVGSFVVPSPEKTETVKVMMRDAVLHEENRCSLFGLKDVSPAMVSAMVVSGILPARGAADPHFCHPPLQDGSRQVPVCDRTAGVDL